MIDSDLDGFASASGTDAGSAKSMFGRSYAIACDDEHCGHCAEAELSGAWDDLDA